MRTLFLERKVAQLPYFEFPIIVHILCLCLTFTNPQTKYFQVRAIESDYKFMNLQNDECDAAKKLPFNLNIINSFKSKVIVKNRPCLQNDTGKLVLETVPCEC